SRRGSTTAARRNSPRPVRRSRKLPGFASKASFRRRTDMPEISTEVLTDFAAGAVNLASARLGAQGIFSTDEFFAPLSRMLNDAPAEFDPDLYDDNGKYMDGWESRRKRVPGHDWSVIRLAMPGRIFGFDV